MNQELLKEWNKFTEKYNLKNIKAEITKRGFISEDGSLRKPKKARNKKTTLIHVIMDESGSMSRNRWDVIRNFNKFIADQRQIEEPTKVSLIKFNDSVKPVFDNVNLGSVRDLNAWGDDYVPSGNTALYDAIGYTILKVQLELNQLKAKRKAVPKVLILVLTDGMENASRWIKSQDMLRALIEEKEAQGNWTIALIGTNKEAVLSASRDLAIPFGNTRLCATNEEMTRGYSAPIAAYRSSGEVATRSLFSK